jgi:hypothetical protein
MVFIALFTGSSATMDAGARGTTEPQMRQILRLTPNIVESKISVDHRIQGPI